MLRFRQFSKTITEETSSEFKKLKHLEHAEDHPINEGEHGYSRSREVLHAVHNALKRKDSDVRVTTKYDGSPSVVFGHHPETGRFFVASKSAFNKNPKLNYTPEDIEKNHGHAPGLVEKLKAALEHLPKVAPKHGVYQGDLMYSEGDVRHEGGKVHFTPNTITYSAPKGSEEGKKVAKSKLGIVVHTKYHGKTLEDMSAGFDPDTKNFKTHPDVNSISPSIDLKKVKHTPENQKYFEHHMEFADDLHSQGGEAMHAAVSQHKDNLKLYINQSVKTGEKPSVKGFIRHLEKVGQQKVDSVKTETSKKKKLEEMHAAIEHVTTNKKHMENAFAIHHHLQQAKDALIKSLNTHQAYEHTIAGKPTNPEGFVAIHKGYPTKLVDRAEFSRANFLARPRD